MGDSLARWREEQEQAERDRVRALSRFLSPEDRRKLDYVSRQLDRGREAEDMALLRGVRKDLLRRAEGFAQ